MPERSKSEAGQVHWMAEKGLAHSEMRAGEGKSRSKKVRSHSNRVR